MHHDFCIHLSVSGHLSCFHVLTIVNNAAMSIGVCVSFELWFSQGICPSEGNGTPLQYSCMENPWTEEPGRLQSMVSVRVEHD